MSKTKQNMYLPRLNSYSVMHFYMKEPTHSWFTLLSALLFITVAQDNVGV